MSRLLPKHRFEEIKREQRQAKLDKRRKVAVRNVSVSFLIVCEGERTEPNYFKALIKDRYSDIREVTIEGKGQGTVANVKWVILQNVRLLRTLHVQSSLSNVSWVKIGIRYKKK